MTVAHALPSFNVKTQVSAVEWQTRVDLAACYRLIALHGWDDLIFTHISAKIPGTEEFLINPFGLMFHEITASSLVKIDISGQKGQPVYAASGGKVVYAGSALRGYGKLIILKHNDDYLSAYAHNDELRVREGDSVKGGAVIANMGSTDAPDVRLHFEIRYKGKSINPMGYLPKR